MTYHIMKVRIAGTWYRSPAVMSDDEFDSLMDLIKWSMPYNMGAFHFDAAGPEMMTNLVMKDMLCLEVDYASLFSNQAGSKTLLKHKVTLATQSVVGRIEKHLLVATEDGYARFCTLDDPDYWLEAPYEVVPLPITRARDFVKRFHRHNEAPRWHKFSIGLAMDNQLVGVVMANTPIARHRDDGLTLEINRCCVLPGIRNACSILIGRAIKCGRAMGYRRFITYTLENESGSSVLAAGFTHAGMTQPSKGWSNKSRKRKTPEKYPVGKKNIWIKEVA